MDYNVDIEIDQAGSCVVTETNPINETANSDRTERESSESDTDMRISDITVAGDEWTILYPSRCAIQAR
jgi:hypothetical protein